MNTIELDFSDLTLLTSSYLLAEARNGYERRGVWGWVLREDLEAMYQRGFAERLLRLARRGLLDRDDVRAPNITRPAWVYRISAFGAEWLRQYDSQKSVIEPLGERTDADRAVYVPPASLTALKRLIAAFDRGAESGLLPGEIGWVTSRDIHEEMWEERRNERDAWSGDDRFSDGFEVEDDDDGQSFSPPDEGWDELRGRVPGGGALVLPRERMPFTDDFNWLVRVGFIQRFGVERPGRRVVVLYRVTPAGRAAKTLEFMNRNAE